MWKSFAISVAVTITALILVNRIGVLRNLVNGAPVA